MEVVQEPLPVKPASALDFPSSRLKPAILKPAGRIFDIGDSNWIRGKCGRSLALQKRRSERFHGTKTQKIAESMVDWLQCDWFQLTPMHVTRLKPPVEQISLNKVNSDLLNRLSVLDLLLNVRVSPSTVGRAIGKTRCALIQGHSWNQLGGQQYSGPALGRLRVRLEERLGKSMGLDSEPETNRESQQ